MRDPERPGVLNFVRPRPSRDSRRAQLPAATIGGVEAADEPAAPPVAAPATIKLSVDDEARLDQTYQLLIDLGLRRRPRLAKAPSRVKRISVTMQLRNVPEDQGPASMGGDDVIRILVVDDHPIVRDGLVAVLQDQADLQVVGSVGTAEEAVALAARLHPDVVLLDLELPGMDGMAAIPRLLEAAPAAHVIVFTAYDTDEQVFGAIQAGARGYLLKGADVAEIVRAVHNVHDGGSHLAPRVAMRVLGAVGAPRRSSTRGLSTREREVLQLLAQGLATKQIARSLGVTERTVKFHVASIFAKLGATNRAQAVALAAQHNLL